MLWHGRSCSALALGYFTAPCVSLMVTVSTESTKTTCSSSKSGTYNHSFISSSHLSPEAAGGRWARLETNTLQPPVIPGVPRTRFLRAEEQVNLLWFAASMTAPPLCRQTVLEENPTVIPACYYTWRECREGTQQCNPSPYVPIPGRIDS